METNRNETQTLFALMTDRDEAWRCSKCSGKGVIDAYHWNKDGLCFKCEGTGAAQDARSLKTVERLDAKIAKLSASIQARAPKAEELPDLADIDLSALMSG